MADRPTIRAAGPTNITIFDADGKETTLDGAEVGIDWGEGGDRPGLMVMSLPVALLELLEDPDDATQAQGWALVDARYEPATADAVWSLRHWLTVHGYAHSIQHLAQHPARAV